MKNIKACNHEINILPGIAGLAEEFDYFIIDLWGVIHDGQKTYPDVIATLRKLRSRNKKIIFLSNAPRRAARAAEVLEKLGITPDLYDHVFTSGEATYEFIEKNPALGGSYYYIGPKKDEGLAEGLDLTRAHEASAADFAIVTGFDGDDSTMEEKLPDIAAIEAAKLPLLCANPDFEVVRQGGERLLCAGLIAAEYQKRGGEVIYFGKPYPRAYEKCLELFGTEDTAKICAIGDNLDTDIKGADDFGIFSVFCTGGILAAELGINPGATPSQQALEALYQKQNIHAQAAIPCFCW